MSEDQTEVTLNPNGPMAMANPDAPRKRVRIATTNIEGSKVTITFSGTVGGGTIEFDAAKFLGAERTTGMAMSVLAYGALAVVQSAYGNAGTEPGAPREAGLEALKKLQGGHWKPGITRRPSEPDPLIQAISEALGRPVDNTYFERYAKKQGLESANAARRELRRHPDVAPVVARIQSERAKAVAASVKGAPKKSLDI